MANRGSAETRKPGQFTGKWSVVSQNNVVVAADCDKYSALNLVANHRRNGRGIFTLRRERVPMTVDIAALDAGDDE